jgi:hypothetical protein
MKIGLIFTCLIYSISLFTQSGNNAIAVDSLKSIRTKSVESHTLSEKDKEILTKQATNSLEDLGRYINVIVDKKNSDYTRNDNMNLALDLFYSDSVLVEISSLNNIKKVKKKIRKYLRALREDMDSKYQRVDVTWADIYVSDNFKKNEEDGRYYGIATFCQRFRAKSIRNKEKFVQYNIEQTTCKDIVLIVEKRMEGNTNFWDLKFGDIEINEER